MDEQSIREHNESIRKEIIRLHKEEGKTLREISNMYQQVNIRYLSELINKPDSEPHPKAASLIGWIKYVQVPICPLHGVVHLGKCPGKKKRTSRPKTPGGWVNAKDPQRAAKQLASRAEYSLAELIIQLEALTNDTYLNSEEQK